jgi:hypothetical protein
MIPVSPATTIDPNAVLTVVVQATALPCESMTERCDVPASMGGGVALTTELPYAFGSSVVSARMRLRRTAVFGGDSSRVSGTSTKSGSP